MMYSASYAGFKWHIYDSAGNLLDSFAGGPFPTRKAMALVTARGDFGKGDWFAAGPGEYEYRVNDAPTLGEVAELLEDLKKRGVTLGALLYVARQQVWWDDRDE